MKPFAGWVIELKNEPAAASFLILVTAIFTVASLWGTYSEASQSDPRVQLLQSAQDLLLKNEYSNSYEKIIAALEIHQANNFVFSSAYSLFEELRRRAGPAAYLPNSTGVPQTILTLSQTSIETSQTHFIVDVTCPSSGDLIAVHLGGENLDLPLFIQSQTATHTQFTSKRLTSVPAPGLYSLTLIFRSIGAILVKFPLKFTKKFSANPEVSIKIEQQKWKGKWRRPPFSGVISCENSRLSSALLVAGSGRRIVWNQVVDTRATTNGELVLDSPSVLGLGKPSAGDYEWYFNFECSTKIDWLEVRDSIGLVVPITL